MSKHILGIDLGTTCSSVAVLIDGKAQIIPNEVNKTTTPSFVSFTKTKPLIGDLAKEEMKLNFRNTVFGIKRIIGRSYNEKITQEEIKNWEFDVVNRNNQPFIKVQYKNKTTELSPEEISGLILHKMKKIADNYLSLNIKDAVVAVPAYFNIFQREATKRACSKADINCIALIKEPIAAAIAYGTKNKPEIQKTIFVYDFGGGTLDLSIITINNKTYQVVAVGGDTHLGGLDIDNKLVKYFKDKIETQHSVRISNKRSVSRLRSACENLKVTLSTKNDAVLDLPLLFDDYTDCLYDISRHEFEEICQDIFDKTIDRINNLIIDSKINVSEFHDIVVVGGSAKIPKIRKMVSDYFGKDINNSFNLEEPVACGAAIFAKNISNPTLEIEKGIVLIDVTPLSLSNVVFGGTSYKIIEKNSPLPIKRSEIFYTVFDYQLYMIFKIVEGERVMGLDNRLLYELKLQNLTPRLKGQTVCLLTIEINKEGDVKIFAQEVETSNKTFLTIRQTDRYKYSEADIDKIIEDSGNNAEKDKQHAESSKSMKLLYDFVYDLRKNARQRLGEYWNLEIKNFDSFLSNQVVWILGNMGQKKEVYIKRIIEVKQKADELQIDCTFLTGKAQYKELLEETLRLKV